MCYALVALVTDYDCWRPHPAGQPQPSLLEEIIGNLQTATERSIAFIQYLLKTESWLVEANCSCRHALDLAVWTSPQAVNPQERKRLAVLFE
jgi:5'-methylthioadenosine phosphorylase